jgi:hypothetical protein
MSELPWSALLALAILIGTVLMMAMDERNRRKFATREELTGMVERIEKDLDGIGRKVGENRLHAASLDERVGHVEEKAALLEERQTQQWGRISEQMAATAVTLRDVMKEVKSVADTQNALALRMERLNRKE